MVSTSTVRNRALYIDGLVANRSEGGARLSARR